MANHESMEKDMNYPEMNFFLNESKSDVIFIVEGQRLPALKHILSFRSEVFDAMFCGNFKESEDKEVVITDTTYNAFKVMLFFLYFEKLVTPDDNDLELMADVLKLADKYQLKRLMACVVQHLISKITVVTVELIAQIAVTYEIQPLIASVKTFIDQNFNHFLSRDQNELNRMNGAMNDMLFEGCPYTIGPQNFMIDFDVEFDAENNGALFQSPGIL